MAQTTSPLPLPSVTPASTEASDAERLDMLAQAIFESMSPEQRVGQLFTVTFQGNDVQFDSDIVDLIHNQAIGGVVLSPRTGLSS